MTAAVAARGAGAAEALPALRDDLRLYPGAPAADGSPSWTLYDPVRGRYFQLGHLAFQLLRHWPLGEPARVARAVERDSGLEVDTETLQEMVLFLRANNLVAGDAAGQLASYRAQVDASRLGWWKWLLHNYLFIRIPLVRPDRFLDRTLPWVRPLLSRRFLLLVVGLGLLGLFLAARRWDEFTHTFLHFFSLQGAVTLAVTLAFAKVLHELGHAYMAKRFGCRVHSMGIAFLVMFPVLFTDVTDAWRLTSRRQRLLIGAAGMLTELCLALLATLLWSFLPDGPLRSVCFMLATVTWVTTLAVNLNPMMKFDGYFLLSDLLGIQNLQERAFALARWQLREWLFGFGETAPEAVSARQQRLMLGWAYATWVWRFFLFLGIALLVYHAFFKALGIVLMAVELAWFIARPLQRELAEWWRRRDELRWNRRTTATLAALCGAVALLLVPWQSRVSVPAVLEAAEFAALYPPASAQIDSVHVRAGERVQAGQLLYQLRAPDLEQQLAQVGGEIELAQRLILRQAASPETLGQLGVLEQQLATGVASYRGLQARIERLQVRAPVAGVLRDVPSGLAPGLWINETVLLGRVVAPQRARLRGFVAGEELERIEAGAGGRFYPEDPTLSSLPLVVDRIETAGVQNIDTPYLSSSHGGAIAVREDRERGAIPTDAQYRVAMTASAGAPDQVVRGTARIEAGRISPLQRLWRTAAGIAIKESGF